MQTFEDMKDCENCNGLGYVPLTISGYTVCGDCNICDVTPGERLLLKEGLMSLKEKSFYPQDGIDHLLEKLI